MPTITPSIVHKIIPKIDTNKVFKRPTKYALA